MTYSFEIWYSDNRGNFWRVLKAIFSRINLDFFKYLSGNFFSWIFVQAIFSFHVIFWNNVPIFKNFSLLEVSFFHLCTIVNFVEKQKLKICLSAVIVWTISHVKIHQFSRNFDVFLLQVTLVYLSVGLNNCLGYLSRKNWPIFAKFGYVL